MTPSVLNGPTGYVFVWADGMPLHPGYLTQRFRILAARAGLPPVRLPDLRHGAAAARGQLEVQQEDQSRAPARQAVSQFGVSGIESPRTAPLWHHGRP